MNRFINFSYWVKGAVYDDLPLLRFPIIFREFSEMFTVLYFWYLIEIFQTETYTVCVVLKDSSCNKNSKRRSKKQLHLSHKSRKTKINKSNFSTTIVIKSKSTVGSVIWRLMFSSANINPKWKKRCLVSKLRIRPTDNHVDASRFTLSTKITPRNKKKFQYFTVHSNISRVLVFRTRISRFLIFPFPGNLKMTTDKATPAAEA